MSLPTFAMPIFSLIGVISALILSLYFHLYFTYFILHNLAIYTNTAQDPPLPEFKEFPGFGDGLLTQEVSFPKVASYSDSAVFGDNRENSLYPVM